jgi:hypothetical protein
LAGFAFWQVVLGTQEVVKTNIYRGSSELRRKYTTHLLQGKAKRCLTD